MRHPVIGLPSCLAAWCALASLALALTPSAGADALAGTWEGFLSVDGAREVRLEIEIADGETAGFVHLRDLGLVNLPIEGVTTRERDVTITTPLWTLSGFLSEDGRMLSVRRSPDRPFVVTTRDNPAFDRFRVARMSPNGGVETAYAYRTPEGDAHWPAAAAGSVGLTETVLESTVARVLRGEEGRIDALLVARNGKLVLEEYFHGTGADSLHTIQSITKSVTSLLFGLVQDGHDLDTSSTIHHLFPEHADKRWIAEKYDITVGQLLTMSAGIDWNEQLPYTDPRNSNTAMNASSSWVGYVLDRGRADSAGESASYTSGLSILLGAVIHKVTGRYVDDLARDTLFRDLGVEEFAWAAHADGTRHTGGGLSLRTRDLAKMGQLVLNGGVWKEQRIVDESWVEASVKRQLPLEGDPDNPRRGYGYQWWIMSFERNGRPEHCIAGLGYGGQFLGIFPDLDLLIVMNAGEFVPGDRYDMGRMVTSVLEAVEQVE